MFLLFLPFFSIFALKMLKSIFLPVFGVQSTQTLVQKYTTLIKLGFKNIKIPTRKTTKCNLKVLKIFF